MCSKIFAEMKLVKPLLPIQLKQTNQQNRTMFFYLHVPGFFICVLIYGIKFLVWIAQLFLVFLTVP